MKELYKKYKKIILYIIVGFISAFTNLFIYYGLRYTLLIKKTTLNVQVSNVLGFIAALVVGYVLYNHLVFETNKKGKEGIKQFFSFAITRIFTLLLSVLILYIFVTLLNYNDKIVKILAEIVVTIINYFVSNYIVFRKKEK